MNTGEIIKLMVLTHYIIIITYVVSLVFNPAGICHSVIMQTLVHGAYKQGSQFSRRDYPAWCSTKLDSPLWVGALIQEGCENHSSKVETFRTTANVLVLQFVVLA